VHSAVQIVTALTRSVTFHWHIQRALHTAALFFCLSDKLVFVGLKPEIINYELQIINEGIFYENELKSSPMATP